MNKNDYGSRKLLALLLSLVMIFSSLGAFGIPVSAAESSEEAAVYNTEEEASEIIDIPVVREKDIQGKGQVQASNRQMLAADAELSVSDSVYAVNVFPGWESVNCNLSVYDYVYNGGYQSYIAEAPIPLYTGQAFADIYNANPGMTFRLELKSITSDDIYIVEDYNIEKVIGDDSVEILGVAANIEPGTYDLHLTAELGDVTYDFQKVQQSFYSELLKDSTLYAQKDASEYKININNIGYIPYNVWDKLSIEVQDVSGDVIAQSNSKMSSLSYDRIEWNIGSFKRGFSTYRINSSLFKTGVCEINKDYSLKLYSGSGSDKKEIVLQTPLTVKYSDKLIIESINIYGQQLLFEGVTDFKIYASISGLRNKDVLSFEMIDSSGEVIARSNESMYDYINEFARLSENIYNMELLSGKALLNSEEYRLRVITSEVDIINRAEGVVIHTESKPVVLSVDRTLADQGKFTMQTANLTVGKEYDIVITKLYLNEESLKTTAICNSRGQLEARFVNGDQPIPFEAGKWYALEIKEKGADIPIAKSEFYISPKEQRGYIYIKSPHVIRSSLRAYEFKIEIEDIPVYRDNLIIELLDNSGNVIAEADNTSLMLETEGYYYDRTLVKGRIILKDGFTPVVGEYYSYRIKINGIEIKEIDRNKIFFTDKVYAEYMHISEDIDTFNLTKSSEYSYNPEFYVSTQEKELNIFLEDIINLELQNKDKLSIKLYKTEYDPVNQEDIDTYVTECTPESITLEGEQYKYIAAVMNIESKISAGSYKVAVSYDNYVFTSYDLSFTADECINELFMEDIVASPTDKIDYTLYNSINMTPEKFSAVVYNAKDEIETTAVHSSTDIYDPYYKYNFDIKLQTGKVLEEGYYSVDLNYEGLDLEKYYYYNTQQLRVTSLPIILSSGYHRENGEVEYYNIRGLNLDITKTYKAYFYGSQKMGIKMASAGMKESAALMPMPFEDSYNLVKEINLGMVDSTTGAFKISPEVLSGIPNNKYYVVVETTDGTVIGDTRLNVVGNVPVPPTDIAPTALINNGAAYTKSTAVKLDLTAAGYSSVKVAESEAALGTINYSIITPNMTYVLSQGDGPKTLYFKFKKIDGTESAVLQQSIYLDTAAPTVPSVFGLKDSAGAVLSDGKIVEGDYLQLFAVGDEKYIKAYARITGAAVDETIKLGYTKQTAENKAEYTTWINFNEYYSSATNITFFFEDYAGNISQLAAKDITVRKLAKIFGGIYKEPSTGIEAVPYQSVLLQKNGENGYTDYSWKYADQDGKYCFDNIPDGDYKLISYAPWGYVDATKEITIAGEDYGWNLVYDSKYQGSGSVDVSVKESDNTAANGANVYLSNWENGLYYTITTGADGIASFADISTTAGAEGMTYHMYVYYNGYYMTKDIVIKDGVGIQEQVTTPAMGELKGTVTNNLGVPVADIDIYAVGTSGQYVWARTGIDGKYSIQVPKDGAVTYRVFISDNISGKTANRTWSNIVPDSGNTDIVLYNKPKVFGTVKGSDGSDIKTTVYASGLDTWTWKSVASGTDGYFAFDSMNKLGIGNYRVGAYSIPGYYSQEKEYEITQTDLEAGEKNLGVIELESYSRDIFTGDFNNVRTDLSYIQKGKNINVRVNYHNTKATALDNVVIRTEIPAGVTLVEGSGALTKNIARLKAGEKGELTFTVKVGDSYSANKITIKAAGIYNGIEQAIGYADIEVVSATINVPGELPDGKAFKVYGEATLDSDVSIIAKNTATGIEEILAVTRPSGRWYNADIKGLAAGEYKLYAKVTKGNDTGLSDFAEVSVTADAIAIEDILIVSPNGQSLGENEETGIAAFSVWVDPQLRGKPIDVSVKFNKGDLPGHYEFINVQYPVANADSKGYMNKLIEGWSGSGTQKLYYVTADGKRFVIAEITILIDPSGYVYDRYTNERIEGAVVTCETKDKSGNWVMWNASQFGMVNPMLTDNEGKYGWMVPDGEYRVKVQKDGYEAYVTTSDGDPKLESIVIPPPRMDVNIGLTNTEKPMVSYTIPENGKEAGIASQITVVFTKPMDTSISTAKLQVTDDKGIPVAGSISFTDNDTRVVFAPTQPLVNGTIYNVLLTGFMDKKDRSNTARSLGDYGFSFTTNQQLETVYLKNTAIVPANAATNVEKASTVTMTFDSNIDAASVTENTVKLLTPAGGKVPATLNTVDNTITLTPDDNLMAGTIYKVVIESDVKSMAGYYLEKDVTSSFTTKFDAVIPGPVTPGTGGGGGGGGGVWPTTDPLMTKLNALLAKGEKELEVATDKDGNVQLTKAVVEKLISNKISIVISNGSIKATIAMSDLKEAISTGNTVKFVLKEKAGISLGAAFKKLAEALELRAYVDSKELVLAKKLAIKLELGDLLKGMGNNLKAGVYRNTGSTFVYVPGSHISKKGIASFKLEAFGEFAVAEYSKKFKDMSKYEWASEFVEIMAARQITTGTGVDEFSPGAPVTRAQFAVFITKALGIEAGNVKNNFNDIEAGKWYTEGVLAAAAAGIVKGDEKGSFKPNDTINREQMAVMVIRAYEYATGSKKSGNAQFEDMTQISAYAKDAVLAAKDLGILDGVGNNKFMPKDTSVRAAAAKIIVKLLELTEE